MIAEKTVGPDLAALLEEMTAGYSSNRGRASIHMRDRVGDTPLHHLATWAGDETISTAVLAGGDIEAIGEFGHTPLHVAALAGNTDALRSILAFRPTRENLEAALEKACNRSVKTHGDTMAILKRAIQQTEIGSAQADDI